MQSPGVLYVVATPLGNLGDLSARAVELLRTVPVVAAEDTRRTRGLLHHLGANPTVLSFHAHSDERRTETLLEILNDGRDVALVSDAGTPVVSDPGTDLVDQALMAGIRVVPIPGPSAAPAALSVSGFGGDRYLFLGFVPRKGTERRRLLEKAIREPWPVIFFEAPSRLVALLEDLGELDGGGRRVVVARELTKLHEEVRRGTLAEVAGYYGANEPRGEVTVILDGRPEPEAEAAVDRPVAIARAGEMLAEGVSRKEAAQRLSAELGLSRNEAYRLVMEIAG